MRLLILCTGNSCRSQMAEGFISAAHPAWEVFSAGTKPAREVHPVAIKVMAEVGIDLSNHKPKLVDQFMTKEFDYVITVCDYARETCPTFLGSVKNRYHIGFEDPALASGSEVEIESAFRRVRDQIREKFNTLFEKDIILN